MTDVHLTALSDASTRLRREADAFQAEVARVNDDPELLPQQKRARIDRLRRDAERRMTAHRGQGQSALDTLRGSLEAQRRVEASQAPADAVARVRALLEQGVALAEIATRAAEAGDVPVVRAAYQEAPFLRVGGDWAAIKTDLGPVYRQIDSALAQTGHGEIDERARGMEAEGERFRTVSEFSVKALSGKASGTPRIALAHAEEAAQR